MKFSFLVLASLFFVSCNKLDEGKIVSGDTIVIGAHVGGRYEACLNDHPTGSTYETLYFISEDKMSWRVDYYSGRDCKDGERLNGDYFYETYSYSKADELFSERPDRMLTAFFDKDLLDEANQLPGNCELMGWEFGEYKDVTGIDSNYCYGGLFQPFDEFIERYDSKFSYEQVRIEGRAFYRR